MRESVIKTFSGELEIINLDRKISKISSEKEMKRLLTNLVKDSELIAWLSADGVKGITFKDEKGKYSKKLAKVFVKHFTETYFRLLQIPTKKRKDKVKLFYFLLDAVHNKLKRRKGGIINERKKT